MDKKTSYIAIGVLVVLVLVGIGTYWTLQNQGYFASNSSTTQQNSNSTTGNNSVSAAYANALKVYADRRIQFDSNCLLTPNDVTYKTGTTIMLDNRSNKKTIISLDNVDYSINAYGYMLITLHTSAALPHTISVDCGKGANQGRILLQQ